MIFAKSIMGIFGRDFEAGWIVLVIGTLGQLANAGVGSSGAMLFMTGRQRYLISIQAGVAVVIIVSSILLVPKWGIIGAISVAAMANVLANLSYLLVVRRTLNLIPYNSSYFRLVLPSVAMLLTLFAVRAAVGTLWPAWLTAGAALAVAYLVFTGVALAFGLNADDKLIAGAVWARVCGMFSKTEANV